LLAPKSNQPHGAGFKQRLKQKKKSRTICSTKNTIRSGDQDDPPPFYGNRVHKSPPLDPILRHMNPVHTLTPCSPKTHFNIIHLPMPKFRIKLSCQHDHVLSSKGQREAVSNGFAVWQLAVTKRHGKKMFIICVERMK